MSGLSDRGRRDRLLRIFKRTGGPDLAIRPIDRSVASDVALLATAGLGDSEEPILRSFTDEKAWVLITSQRVIVRTPVGQQSLSWSDVLDATVDITEAVTDGPGKLGLHTLRIVSETGDPVQLDLAPGSGFVGFWNVIKSIAAMR